MIQAGYVRNVEPRGRPSTALRARPVLEPEVAARNHDGGRGLGYGEARRPRWLAMATIIGLHAILLAALVYFDVVTVGRKPVPRLTVVEIRPEPVVPPPAAPPEMKRAPDKVVEQPIVAPPPIVQVPAALPVAAAPAAPPPAPPSPPASAAATSAPVSEAAAPVSAPDGSAKNLGNPAPRYPMDARRNRWEGVVRLRVVITPEGAVREISVARSSGHDSLDDAALGTVRKWRFVPGKQAGVPIEAVGYLSIPFRLT